MSKAKGLLDRITKDLKELQGMSGALPKEDRGQLDSIVSNFGKFEQGLHEEVKPVKEIKTVGQLDLNASSDSERMRI